MAFTVFNGELVVRGLHKDQDFALITVRTPGRDHTVQVYWAGLEQDGVKEISPVDITLPESSLKQLRGRQMQSLRHCQENSVTSEHGINDYACRMTVLMDRLLRQPLAFFPIRLGAPLVVRAVVVPDEINLPNVPIGIVSNIHIP